MKQMSIILFDFFKDIIDICFDFFATPILYLDNNSAPVSILQVVLATVCFSVIVSLFINFTRADNTKSATKNANSKKGDEE